MITGPMLVLLLLAVSAYGDHRTLCSRGPPFGIRGLDNNVTVLDRYDCNIKKIELGAFENLPNLKTIRLHMNKIEHIDIAVFDSLPELMSLYLNSNKLHEMPNFSEHSLPNLQELFLTSNQITVLNNSKTFSGTLQLRKLDLSFNLIEHIHPDIFKPLTNLRELYLNDNKIKFISEVTFPIQTLKKLTLDHNLIEYVSPGVFRGAKFEGLRLDFNKISYLPANMATDFVNSGARLESFRFCYNTWNCACLIEQVLEVMKLGVRDYDVYWDRQLSGAKPACKFVGTSCHRETT